MGAPKLCDMSWTFLAPEKPVLELILRAVLVYVFLVAALRLSGRRELAQMTTFDLVLVLILSNAVQNSINAGDNSLGGGLISAATLLSLNWMVGYSAYRWRGFRRLVQGRPLAIVTHGRVHTQALHKEQITLEELRSALRKQGIGTISECKTVILEPDGTLTAIREGTKVHTLHELSLREVPGEGEL